MSIARCASSSVQSGHVRRIHSNVPLVLISAGGCSTRTRAMMGARSRRIMPGLPARRPAPRRGRRQPSTPCRGSRGRPSGRLPEPGVRPYPCARFLCGSRSSQRRSGIRLPGRRFRSCERLLGWAVGLKRLEDQWGGFRPNLPVSVCSVLNFCASLGSASALAVTRICELSPRNLIARKARLVPWALRALEARASSSR